MRRKLFYAYLIFFKRTYVPYKVFTLLKKLAQVDAIKAYLTSMFLGDFWKAAFCEKAFKLRNIEILTAGHFDSSDEYDFFAFTAEEEGCYVFTVQMPACTVTPR